MTTDEKLAAILAAVQIDPGNRGLAKLFPVCAADFAAACRSIAEHPSAQLEIITGFYIPSADPPAFETDGLLGSVFLLRALSPIDVEIGIYVEAACQKSLVAGIAEVGWPPHHIGAIVQSNMRDRKVGITGGIGCLFPSHLLALERVGPADNDRCLSMRGIDITDRMLPVTNLFRRDATQTVTIGIGDGGNEIGMGKLPHELVAANVPNGDLIHCRVATDFLILAGVSNWGAYALAAGVYVLRGKTPPADLFDPAREREILEVMVREGPLVDGVTGKQTATVDGLSWEDYAKPLVRIREILAS